jgi:PKD repeat protein
MIVKWWWEFGDGTTETGETATHLYESAGSYTVVLHVLDDGGLDGSDATTVQVKQGNTPPAKPLIKTTGTLPIPIVDTTLSILRNQEIKGSFTLSSQDANNDSVYFIIDWRDNNTDTTKKVESGSRVDLNHTWSEQVLYEVSVVAKDDENLSSEKERIFVIINVRTKSISGQLLGYLLDYSNTGAYTHFFDTTLLLETSLGKNNEDTYLIDNDGIKNGIICIMKVQVYLLIK